MIVFTYNKSNIKNYLKDRFFYKELEYNKCIENIQILN